MADKSSKGSKTKLSGNENRILGQEYELATNYVFKTYIENNYPNLGIEIFERIEVENTGKMAVAFKTASNTIDFEKWDILYRGASGMREFSKIEVDTVVKLTNAEQNPVNLQISLIFGSNIKPEESNCPYEIQISPDSSILLIFEITKSPSNFTQKMFQLEKSIAIINEIYKHKNQNGTVLDLVDNNQNPKFSDFLKTLENVNQTEVFYAVVSNENLASFLTNFAARLSIFFEAICIEPDESKMVSEQMQKQLLDIFRSRKYEFLPHFCEQNGMLKKNILKNSNFAKVLENKRIIFIFSQMTIADILKIGDKNKADLTQFKEELEKRDQKIKQLAEEMEKRDKEIKRMAQESDRREKVFREEMEKRDTEIKVFREEMEKLQYLMKNIKMPVVEERKE